MMSAVFGLHVKLLVLLDKWLFFVFGWNVQLWYVRIYKDILTRSSGKSTSLIPTSAQKTLPTFQLNASVIIRAKVKIVWKHQHFIAMHCWGYVIGWQWRSKVSENRPSLPVWILNLSTICQFRYSLYYVNNNCTCVTSVMAGRGISLLQWIYMPHRLCKLTTCYDGYVPILGSFSAGQLTLAGGVRISWAFFCFFFCFYNNFAYINAWIQ